MHYKEYGLNQQYESDKAHKEYQRAVLELRSGNTLAALARVEAALKLHDEPAWYPCLGFCIAKERGHIMKGLALCQDAVAREPDHSEHYYYLARVLLVAGRKPEAISVLRKGLAHGDSAAARQLLHELGIRKPLLFPQLHRDNPLNKYVGMLFSRLGLR